MQYRTQSYSFGGADMTPAVKILLIANIAVFLAQLVMPPSVVMLFGLVPELVWEHFYIWQVFTYQFFHGGLFHILFNMLALWMFGCTLERRWGTEFFLKYYFVTVIGGGILNTLLLPHQFVPSIGASAGIYGLLMAYALIYPDQIIYFYFLFPMKMKHFVWIIGGIALYSAMASGQSGIAHLAHLGGMLFGYLYLRGLRGLPRFSLVDTYKNYRDRRRLERLKKRFHLHTGGKDRDDDRTLH